MVVPPVKELVPLNTSVPAPSLVSEPVEAGFAPDIVRVVPLATSIEDAVPEVRVIF